MTVLAIDPGPENSAFVVWDGAKVLDFGITSNYMMRVFFNTRLGFLETPVCAIEMIACYGMAVGAETFETCVWIGRFMELWRGGEIERIPRLDIKIHLCKTAKAKDANVRQALIDRFGAPGTKKQPGVTYGITSHCWAALALAVCAHDRLSIGA